MKTSLLLTTTLLVASGWGILTIASESDTVSTAETDGTCINDDVDPTPPPAPNDEEPNDEDDDSELEEKNVWTVGTVDQMYEELDCPEANEGFTQIHTRETWETFNQIYNEVVGPEKSSLPPKFTSNGFQHPIEIKFDPQRGRGVFATTLIPEGSLIWQSDNTAIFEDPQDYRNFIRKLPQPLACDVLIWAYSRMISEERDDEFYACVDLDEGSFINSGGPSKRNMALGLDDGPMPHDVGEEVEKQSWYGCKLKFYALKDIPPGAEIMADYGEFAEPHGWEELGLYNTL
jgi:hypothetical protein